MEVLTVQNPSFLGPHLPGIWWSPDPCHQPEILTDDVWPLSHRCRPPLALESLTPWISRPILLCFTPLFDKTHCPRCSRGPASGTPSGASRSALDLPHLFFPLLVVEIEAGVQTPLPLSCVCGDRVRGFGPLCPLFLFFCFG